MDNTADNTADDTNQLTDWQQVEQINAIKENLRDLPWDQIRNDPLIIRSAFSVSGNYDIDPASMLVMERTSTLSKLFANYQTIPPSRAKKILERFLKFNLQRNFLEFPQELNDLVPNLQPKTTDPAQLAEIQKETVGLVNGLENLKNISLLRIIGELATDLQSVSRIPPDRLTPLQSELNGLIENFRAKLDRLEDPTKEEVDQAANYLKNFGRTDIEIERIKSMTDNLQLIAVLRNLQDVVEIVLEANKEGVANQLNDPNVVAEILLKVKNI